MTSIVPAVSPSPLRQREEDIFDHVTWLLFFKSKEERQKFQRFFRERSTVKSFLPLAFLSLLTTLMIIAKWKTKALGGKYATENTQIIQLLCISIVTSLVAVVQMLIRCFRLSESESRAICAVLENLFMILTNIVFGDALIISTRGPQCVYEEEPLIQFCDPLRFAGSIPYGSAVFILFLPVIGASLLRCADWWCILVCYGLSIGQFIAACIIKSQKRGTATLVVIALLSLAIIYERRRTKVEYYLAFREEFDYLNIKREKDVAEAKCNAAILEQNELRHTIANLAHDLKTVHFSPFLTLFHLLNFIAFAVFNSRFQHCRQDPSCSHQSCKNC